MPAKCITMANGHSRTILGLWMIDLKRAEWQRQSGGLGLNEEINNG